MALHNIPEGISVSVPIFYATGRRGRAFAYSLLTGSAPSRSAASSPRFALNWFLPAVRDGTRVRVGGRRHGLHLDRRTATSRPHTGHGRSHEILACIAGGMAGDGREPPDPAPEARHRPRGDVVDPGLNVMDLVVVRAALAVRRPARSSPPAASGDEPCRRCPRHGPGGGQRVALDQQDGRSCPLAARP
ncbi:MAG: hypothetical protein MZV70_42785 [Desulfobacterales bacterium]|nr:hypothetical protein [Desulfobacterales bacterium]